MKWMSGAAVAFAMSCHTMGAAAWGVTVYTDRTLFEAAAGSGLQLEDFEGVATNAAGEAAFSNGATFGDGGFSIHSLTLDSDVTVSQGLTGTFLIRTSTDPAYNQWMGPGGVANSSSLRDDDDFRIQFTQPVVAFGILIYDNVIEPDETITLFREDETEIISMSLPGDTSGTGGHGFLGFVLNPGADPIGSVVVLEGQTLNDDLGFDWVYFEPIPEPHALAIWGIVGLSLVRFRRRRSGS